MTPHERWAYQFHCPKTLEEVLDILKETGPWSWTLNDNYLFGDYLNTRPIEGTRVRIHFFPQGFVQKIAQEGFSALLELAPSAPISRLELDQTFRTILRKISATGITPKEPYD